MKSLKNKHQENTIGNYLIRKKAKSKVCIDSKYKTYSANIQNLFRKIETKSLNFKNVSKV
jgi:hypothetical protein